MSSTVVETGYYELLGVAPTANGAEIRKAFLQMAIRNHPDRNPSDKGAKSRFQEVAEAYIVLINPELRRLYDQVGKDEVIPSRKYDGPVQFAALLFDGKAFKSWVGELEATREVQQLSEEQGRAEEQKAAASSASQDQAASVAPHTQISNVETLSEAQKDCHPSSEEITEIPEEEPKVAERQFEREESETAHKEEGELREERVSKITKALLEKLSVWTDGPKSEDATKSFMKKLELEANELKMECFGLDLLHVIGTVYYLRANIYLKSQKSLGLGGFFGKMKERSGMVRDGWNASMASIEAQKFLQEAIRLRYNPFLTTKQRAEVEYAILSRVLYAMWMGTRLEVQSVLRDVCDRIFNDNTVPSKKRTDRARAVALVGDVFRQTRRTASEEKDMKLFEELITSSSGKKEKK